jgi:hypothetical protein
VKHAVIRFSSVAFPSTLLLVGIVAAQSAPPRKDIPAIAKAANGVIVSIITSDKDGKPVAQGTGFLVSKDGRIVTNYHVIKDASSAIVKFPDGAFYDVDGVVAFDKVRDLAIIKTHGQNFPVVTLGNSDRVQVGQEIVAIGSPLSLESTVSSGIVSGIRTIEEEGGKFLQITAPISPGSSGGPLFNMGGEVVGITTLYLKGGENLNFAIPINDAKRLLSAGSKLQDFPVEIGTVKSETPVDILKWIQSHFETVTVTDSDYKMTNRPTLSFDGCQVTVNDYTYHTVPKYPQLNKSSIIIVGPFNLKDLRPDVEVLQDSPVPDFVPLRLSSFQPFVFSTSDDDGKSWDKTNSHTFVLLFATRDIAERQQRAWHDAIIACGGKAVPDNMY